MARLAGPRCGAIYRITCIPKGWSYVGLSSWDVEQRWKAHEKALREGAHHNDLLQADWSALGPDAFEFAVLERLSGPIRRRYEQGAARERHWTSIYAAKGGCYSARPGAGVEIATAGRVPEWMTVKQTAELKQAAESAVRLALITGRLKGQKHGRDWWVNRASAQAWVPQRRGPKPRKRED